MEKTWIINSLELKISEDDINNVINNVNWCYSITDEGYQVDENGILTLGISDYNTFIPLEDITQEVIIGWLIAGIDMIGLNNRLLMRLEDLKNPQIITYIPNWDPTDDTSGAKH